MPNKYDLTEIIGDLAGAALISKVSYKKYKTKTLIAFVAGDAIYVYMFRKKFLTDAGYAVTPIGDSEVDINKLDNKATLYDAAGKLGATLVAKLAVNAVMAKGGIFSGMKEMVWFNVVGQAAGHGARYIQDKYENSGTGGTTGTTGR